MKSTVHVPPVQDVVGLDETASDPVGIKFIAITIDAIATVFTFLILKTHI
jgi:hypothetical protein